MPAPAPAPVPAPVNPDLVTSVTPPTYAVGSVEKGAWDVLEHERAACGFGLLQQDSRLDVASHAHAFYLAQNSVDQGQFFLGHFEDPAPPYFYAAAPWDRAVRSGLPAGSLTTEILSSHIGFALTSAPPPLVAREALGASEMRGLLETVYHLAGALSSGRTGGVGSQLSSGALVAHPGNTFFAFDLVGEVSVDAKPQVLGGGTMATWPCAATVGVKGAFAPAQESPNPFPDIVDPNVVYGTPVYFKADAGSVLTVASATITKVADGTVLGTRVVTKSNDPAGHVGVNEAFMVPTTALAAGSSYAVTMTGTIDGAPIARTFTFATAP